MDSKNHKKIYLVDGSGYIFRAFYVISSLRTKDGFPTNALYGFTRMLLRLLKESDSEHVVVVFDAGRATFRNEMYDQYKANRKECPEDLSKQMPYFREIAQTLGLPILQKVGFEADDIIGTLSKRLVKAEIECVIVSGDKDLMQLVNDKVNVWDTMKDVHVNEEGVRAKLGVAPGQVVDLLGLMGDSSDNVPGLEGVGPKTAVQLIQKYGDIENIIAATEKILEDKEIRNRQKIVDKLRTTPDILRLSRKLVEIKCDVPADIEISSDQAVAIADLKDEEIFKLLVRKEVNQENLKALVDRLEFNSLVEDFDLALKREEQEVSSDSSYQVIDRKAFPDWLEKFKQVKKFAFDLETTSLDVFLAEIVGVAVCWSETEAFYIPIAHKIESDEIEQVSLTEFITQCCSVLNNAEILKVGQNLKYDTEVLANHDVIVRGVAFDTMIAAYLLNPDRRSYNLTTLANDYLGQKVIEYDDVVGDRDNFSSVNIKEACRYACQDAHYAWLLEKKLSELIDRDNLRMVLSDIETPLVEV